MSKFIHVEGCNCLLLSFFFYLAKEMILDNESEFKSDVTKTMIYSNTNTPESEISKNVKVKYLGVLEIPKWLIMDFLKHHQNSRLFSNQ